MDTETFRADVIEILKDADLSKLSTKKIRLQLEEKYKTKLADRKTEIDEIVMTEMANLEKKKEEKKSKDKQPKSNGKPSKRKHSDSDDDDNDDDDDDDEEEDDVKEEKSSSDDDKDVKPNLNTEADEDIARQLQEEEESGAVRRTRHAHKKRAPNKTEKKPRKKGTPRENGFTETCNLSPELAAIVGEDKMRRSDVVKKMWAIIKEKNLFYPKNKRFMICDEQMMSVFGKKKVCIFGMMKYLSSHIYKDDEIVDS